MVRLSDTNLQKTGRELHEHHRQPLINLSALLGRTVTQE